MFLTIIFFILGFVFLIKGAGIMIDGSSSIAKRYGISNFFIGLTIVAFGTSAPELVISALASIKGSSGIALGNIIGSNISNTLLILGVSAIICPLIVRRATVHKEIPFSLLAILAVGILANDFLIDGQNGSIYNSLTRIDGLILILFFSIFIYYTFGITKDKEPIIAKAAEQLKEKKADMHSNIVSILMIIAGLAGLAVGGRWIVDGAIAMANYFSLSEAFIGLTIVAIGTSLPELAASATAAYRGKTDIAVGNVIGSNIFNLFWVLGLSSIISAIGYNPVLNIDLLILIAITILLLFLIYIGKKNILGKWEGMVLVLLYLCYLMFLVCRG
ncbi:MAG: calcium/sodium antiporter [Patescibacteria group bacterium]|nr:calcium/sodium antiporter [Patescibacteria group bacterium]